MWDKAVIATLVWFVVIYKFRAVWRDGRWRTGSVTFYFWLFCLFMAIGLTLMVWPVYLAFDSLVGLPNFGWLVTYVAVALAIYYISAGCYLVLEQPQPRFMLLSLLATLIILVVVYAMSIVALPVKPDHTIPETLSELIFMETLYVYVAALCAIPLATFTRLFRREQIVSARLRWLVAILASFFSFAVVTLKIVLTLLAFENPLTPALAIIFPMITAGVAAIGVLIMLAFMPNSLYLAFAWPVEFASKLIAWHELRMLQQWLDPLYPPVINSSPSLPAVLRDLDFHLYRVVIAILDAKKTLAGYANATGGLTIQPALITHTAGRTPGAWDEQQLQRARVLHRELQKVDDDQEFLQLVRAYQQVTRRMRRPTSTSLFGGGSSIDVAYQG
jgi:hypothetical protein